jgi:hypothetical protein
LHQEGGDRSQADAQCDGGSATEQNGRPALFWFEAMSRHPNNDSIVTTQYEVNNDDSDYCRQKMHGAEV